MGPVVLGMTIGVSGAFAISRVVARLLFGVSVTDPATFGSVAAVVLLVALLASWIPAHHASRLDPLRALR